MSWGLFGSEIARISAFPWDKCTESWQASAEGLKTSGQNVPLEAEAAFCTLPLCLRALDSGWGIPKPQHFLPLNSCPQIHFFTPTEPPCRPLKSPRQVSQPPSFPGQAHRLSLSMGTVRERAYVSGNTEERTCSFLTHPMVHSRFRKFSAISLCSCSHFPVFLGKFREVIYSDW